MRKERASGLNESDCLTCGHAGVCKYTADFINLREQLDSAIFFTGQNTTEAKRLSEIPYILPVRVSCAYRSY